MDFNIHQILSNSISLTAETMLSTNGLDPSWKEVLCQVLMNTCEMTPLFQQDFESFCKNFETFTAVHGKIQDSLFLHGVILNNGILNCELSRIQQNPSIVIVRSPYSSDTKVDTKQVEKTISNLQSHNINIIISLDPIPPILHCQLLINNYTIFHQLELPNFLFIASILQNQILDTLNDLKDDIKCNFSGIFFAITETSQISHTDIELPTEVKKIFDSGYIPDKELPTAFFIPTEKKEIGTIFLRGEDSKKIAEFIVPNLLKIVFHHFSLFHPIVNLHLQINHERNASDKSYTWFFDSSYYPPDRVLDRLPYTLISLKPETFGQSSLYLTRYYSEKDTSLKDIISTFGNSIEDEEKFYYTVIPRINRNIFSVPFLHVAQILHSDICVTLSCFGNYVVPVDSPNAVVFFCSECDQIYKSVLPSLQFFSLSFSSMLEIIANDKSTCMKCGHKAFDSKILLICSGKGYMFEKQIIGMYQIFSSSLFQSHVSDELPIFPRGRLFASLLFTTEFLIAQSLAQCPPESSAPYFRTLSSFVTKFGEQVYGDNPNDPTLLPRFMNELYRWFAILESISSKFKSFKLSQEFLDMSTSICRYLVFKLLNFIKYEHLNTALDLMRVYEEFGLDKDRGVKEEWLKDRIEQRIPKSPRSNEVIEAFADLAVTACGNFMYPHITLFKPITLDTHYLSSILAFTYASDRFVAQIINQSNIKINDPMNDILNMEQITDILNRETLSSSFQFDINEKLPSQFYAQFSPKVSIEIMYPLEFFALSSLFGYSLDFLISHLARCFSVSKFGGKSDAKFFSTSDKRFLIKTLKAPEMDSMPTLLPDLFKYILEHPDSMCVRFLSIFNVSVQSTTTNYSYSCILMEDLSYQMGDYETYDFKGSERDRMLTGENNVKLDANYTSMPIEKRVILSYGDKLRIMRQLKDDTKFLAQHNIMDYSLIAILSKNKREGRLGLIDYFRPYTLIKALESLVKKTPIYQEHKMSPTIISPQEYRKRFLNAMSQYFYVSPRIDDANFIIAQNNC